MLLTPAQIKPSSFESRRNSFFNSGRMCSVYVGASTLCCIHNPLVAKPFGGRWQCRWTGERMWHSRTPCCSACFPCGVVALASSGSRRLTTCTVFALTTRPLPLQNISLPFRSEVQLGICSWHGSFLSTFLHYGQFTLIFSKSSPYFLTALATFWITHFFCVGPVLDITTNDAVFCVQCPWNINKLLWDYLWKINESAPVTYETVLVTASQISSSDFIDFLASARQCIILRGSCMENVLLNPVRCSWLKWFRNLALFFFLSFLFFFAIV